jgi:hypothetical protein
MFGLENKPRTAVQCTDRKLYLFPLFPHNMKTAVPSRGLCMGLLRNRAMIANHNGVLVGHADLLLYPKLFKPSAAQEIVDRQSFKVSVG